MVDGNVLRRAPMTRRTRDSVSEARAFAELYFAGETSKGDLKRPRMDVYDRVAEKVRMNGGSLVSVSAVYLVDLVEDKGVPLDEIRRNFGPVIAKIVGQLADPPEVKKLPVKAKKDAQKRRFADPRTDIEAKRLKLAFITEKLEELVEHPPTGWSHSDCKEYVAGSFGIATVCMEASKSLTREFIRAYQKALSKYNR